MTILCKPTHFILFRNCLGNVYIADGGNLIRKVTVSTGVITTVAGTGSNEFSGDGGQATSAGLSDPCGIAVDLSDNVYIADTYNYRVRKVTASTGVIATIAGSGVSSFLGDGSAATSANLLDPRAVAVDSAGNMYIADYLNNRIRKVTRSTGIITTYAGAGSCDYYSGDESEATSVSICGVYDLALDASGNLYIAETEGSVIRKVTVSTGIVSTFAGLGADNGFTGDGGPAISAALSYPHGIALDSSGRATTCDSPLYINITGQLLTTPPST